jgi:putative peptidoglycan lipid II flippase
MNPQQQMLRSSVVVAFFNLLGGLSGILVETSIAANMGLSVRSDTFYVAYTIPYIITNLLTATGQFSLVPFFASLESSRDERDFWHGFSYVTNILVLGLGAISVVGVVASPWIIRGIAPGFTHEENVLATQLSRWLFLIIVPAGMGELLRSFLLSRHYFALSTASGFIRNVTTVVVILMGFHRFGPQSIFLGYLGGYLLQLVILGIPILVNFRPRYSPVLTASGDSFRNLRGAGTAQLGVALAWQGVVVVERIIASFLPPGTLTALNYGFKILGSLAELLGGSVGTASLPALSRAFSANNYEEVRRTLRDTMELSLLLLSPMAVFCLTLNHSIIRLVFQRGKFTPGATDVMAMIFFYYSLSLFAFTFLRLLNTYLFARREPGAYFRLSLFHYGLVLLFDLFYVGVLHLGAKGIPLGFLTGATLACGLAVRRNLGGLDASLDPALGRFSLKVMAAALGAALSVWGLRAWMAPPVTTSQDIFYLCVICGTGSLVYLGVLAALRAIPVNQLAALWPSANES